MMLSTYLKELLSCSRNTLEGYGQAYLPTIKRASRIITILEKLKKKLEKKTVLHDSIFNYISEARAGFPKEG